MPLARAKPGEKIPAFPSDQLPANLVLVRFKGPFDYTYLARTVQRWFEQRRFRFNEVRIKDAGKKMKIEWEAKRKIDEFYQEDYKIKMEMWNLSTQEIIVNGEPRKILNGMVQFEISGSVTVDRNKFFDPKNGKLIGLLGKIFFEANWREMGGKYINAMEYRCQDIQILIKHCLNMTTKENAPW